MIAAIHQPNFFPWMGYFRKIAMADVFVFLDTVQFPRTSRGSWINRVKILVDGEPRWLTCPIVRSEGIGSIADIMIDNGQPWREKMVKTLAHFYGKAPCFAPVIQWVEPMIHRPSVSLAEYNIANIMEISERLGLSPKFERQSQTSDPGVLEKSGSERLAAICQMAGADTYLAGDGAAGYEDESVYEKAGVRLVKSGFANPRYHQYGLKDFAPGMSILDALFNIGAEKTAELVKTGA
ncbi:MAG: WbqC family protein [Nitrospinae bacterium]|nr:WbqC family protein [Nitrospinota bacterium]